MIHVNVVLVLSLRIKSLNCDYSDQLMKSIKQQKSLFFYVAFCLSLLFKLKVIFLQFWCIVFLQVKKKLLFQVVKVVKYPSVFLSVVQSVSGRGGGGSGSGSGSGGGGGYQTQMQLYKCFTIVF